MNTLNRCPICLGKAILESVPCKRGVYWWVRCCNGCVCTQAYESKNDAVEDWNSLAEGSEDGQT